MNFLIYRLRFPQGIHISTGTDDLDKASTMVHSDTLCAALAAARAERDLSADLLPYTVSSLFPFVGDRLFFPRPKSRPSALTPVEGRSQKSIKKVKWIDQGLLQQVLNGGPLPWNTAHLKGSFASEMPLDEEPIHSTVRQRIQILRGLEEGTSPEDRTRLFNHHYLECAPDGGLYFMALEREKETLESDLNYLQHSGLGTDRNVGFGRFNWECAQLSLNLPNQAEHGLTLGLIAPESNEQAADWIDSPLARWDLLPRGGWISSTARVGLRKKTIHMFDVGSVLRLNGLENGKATIDLTPASGGPDHPVYRCGHSLTLPIALL
jgi:CRISPR-associated protein Csm4